MATKAKAVLIPAAEAVVMQGKGSVLANKSQLCKTKAVLSPVAVAVEMQGKGGVLATKAAAVQGNGGALTGGGGGEGQDTLGGQPVNGRPHRLYTGGRHGEGRCKDEGKDGGKTRERTVERRVKGQRRAQKGRCKCMQLTAANDSTFLKRGPDFGDVPDRAHSV